MDRVILDQVTYKGTVRGSDPKQMQWDQSTPDIDIDDQIQDRKVGTRVKVVVQKEIRFPDGSTEA